MATLPVLDELPAGYFVEESPRGILALSVDAARTLHEAGFGPDTDGATEPSELVGRRPMHQIRSNGEVFVLRRFTHGGLARWLTRRRFLRAERPFRELILSDSLRRVGIPTPQVVAARARKAAVFGWSLDVLTRRIEGTTDLGFVLARAERGELSRVALRRVLAAAGALVRRLHAHGCVHADLCPNNVLVGVDGLEQGELETWILDLDRSYFAARVSDSERRANLARLFRHVERRERQRGRGLSRTDYARFLRAYDPERRHWKEDWRSIVRRHGMGRAFHGVGQLFERLFAKGGDPRAGGRPASTPGPASSD